MKNDGQLIKKLEYKTNLLETWKLAVEYPNLRELARNRPTLVLFRSTYTCVRHAVFSRMNYLKEENSIDEQQVVNNFAS